MLGLWGSLTFLFIRYYIRLLSSQWSFCLIAFAHSFCCIDCAPNRQSRRWTFRSPFACFLSSPFQIRQNWSPSLSSSIVSSSGHSMCVCLANLTMLPALDTFPSLSLISWRYACILSYHIWIVGLKCFQAIEFFGSSFLRALWSPTSTCTVL